MSNPTSSHSPLVGFMADGLPLYGPRAAGGALPSDLDACNGHASDLGFYHYHATTNAPYLPGCLRGCVTKSYGWSFGGSSCSKAASKLGGAWCVAPETVYLVCLLYAGFACFRRMCSLNALLSILVPMLYPQLSTTMEASRAPSLCSVMLVYHTIVLL